MAINVGEPARSTRTHTLDGQQLLVLVDESHQVGTVPDTEQRYTRLQQWAAERYGVTDLRYRWSTQDDYTFDRSTPPASRPRPPGASW